MSEVAHRHGITVKDLSRINGIADPDRIEAGQVIALRARDVCKVRILLIDWDRNPIQGAKVRLEYCGKTKMLTSKANGSVSEIITETPEDLVAVSIMRLDGSWETVARVRSGWGNKLVTLVSPKLKLVAETRLHPKDASGRPVPAPPKRQAPQPIPCHSPIATTSEGTRQSDFGDGKGVKIKNVDTKEGIPLVRVSNDQATLDFLQQFNGEVLCDADFESAAKFLGVEEAVVRAVAEVESGGTGFVKINGCTLPTLNYERHYFHRLTKGKHSAENADISWRYGYYLEEGEYVPTVCEVKDSGGLVQTRDCWRPYRGGQKDKLIKHRLKTGKEIFKSGTASRTTDGYLNCATSYKRLAKAYAINPEAALCSCSWGAFQIMGQHYHGMRYPSIFEFAAAMSRSEREQLKAYVLFLKHIRPDLTAALQKKDFSLFAKGYNGPNFKMNRYDEKMYSACEKWEERKLK